MADNIMEEFVAQGSTGSHRYYFPLQKKKGGKMEVYPCIITLLHLERPKLYIEFWPFLVQ